MSDFISDWVTSLQEQGQKQLYEFLESEKKAMTELEQKLQMTRKPQELQTRLTALEKEFEELQKKKQEILEEIERSERLAQQFREKEIQRLLSVCKAIISVNQTQADRALLDQAQLIFHKYSQHKNKKLDQLTPSLLATFFSRYDLEEPVRSWIQRSIEDAWDVVKDFVQVQHKVQQAQEKRDVCKSECEEIKENLVRTHQMARATLDALEAFSTKPNQLKQLCTQFLEVHLQNARLEQTWNLPGDVFGELP